MNISRPAAACSSIPRLQGEFYLEILRQLHIYLQPATYLEIGTDKGASLRLSQAVSIAVDPQFRFDASALTNIGIAHLYQMTSDLFFERHNPRKILGEPIALAFLDGMHQFEFLVRDFMNTERQCAADSLIVLHDCLPTDLYMARRDQDDQSLRGSSAYPDDWAGDVWKILPILRRYRPDLDIFCIDAPPSGLVFIRNLNPNCDVLRIGYDQILREIFHLNLADYGIARLHSEFDVRPTSELWNDLDGLKKSDL